MGKTQLLQYIAKQAVSHDRHKQKHAAPNRNGHNATDVRQAGTYSESNGNKNNRPV